MEKVKVEDMMKKFESLKARKKSHINLNELKHKSQQAVYQFMVEWLQ